MLFSVGSHPVFARDSIEGSFIEFSEPETLDLYGLGADGLLTKRADNWLNQETPLSASLFDDDALIFQNIQSRTICLKCKNESRIIELYNDHAPDIGFWAKPGAPYVCIEPWFGFDDAPDRDGLF